MAKADFTTIRSEEDKVIYRAIRILNKRLKKPGELLNCPTALRAFLKLRLAEEEREVFYVLFLDIKNRLISAEIMFAGTLAQTSVHPREVARRALQHNSAAVIFAHNHPSGAPYPSESDRKLTQVLKQSLALVEVRTLDHFIIGGDGVMSFAEQGMI